VLTVYLIYKHSGGDAPEHQVVTAKSNENPTAINHSSLNDAQGSIPENKEQGQNLKKKMVDLTRKTFAGDADARHELITVAEGENLYIDSNIRLSAIVVLTHDQHLDSLTAAAKLLLSSDPRIRTTVYCNLPTDLQVKNFDYTADPNENSKAKVEELIASIPQYLEHKR